MYHNIIAHNRFSFLHFYRYALLNAISPLFCEKFGAALSEELTTKLADRINEK